MNMFRLLHTLRTHKVCASSEKYNLRNYHLATADRISNDIYISTNTLLMHLHV